MVHPRRRQLIALLGVVALLLATTLYGAHLHHPSLNPDRAVHCDLCPQLGGTSGPPASPALVSRIAPVLVGLQAIPSSAAVFSHEPPRSHRSRAPPFSLT
jgi:hypothetical protein